MTPSDTCIQAPAHEALPQYEGFPYLNTRLVPALYHIALLPVDAPQSTLVTLARRQVDANRLDCCLVFAADRCMFFWADGRVQATSDTPRGGTLLTNSLELSVDFLPTLDLRRREADLVRIVEAGRRKGRYIFGNPAKGGRKATPEELERLQGANLDGVPSGLVQCATCREWRGACLDTNPQFAGMLVPVHCRCENHNRCARCGRTLYGRRLNANFYDPHDRGIWHVPGFCGLSHKCAGSTV